MQALAVVATQSNPVLLENNKHNQAFSNTAEHQLTPQRNSQEEPFFYYQESYVKESIKNCQNSVIGKFLSNKIIPLQQIQNTLNGIWGKPVGFKIVELEGKTYQFLMEKTEDTQNFEGEPMDCEKYLACVAFMGQEEAA